MSIPGSVRRHLPLFLLPLALLAGCGSGSGSPTPVEPDEPGEPAAPVVAPEAVAWLNDHVVEFRTDDPEGDLSDLEPLREMIGDARVVALGEATHGTREFFRMKDRILRFLVREMGFNAFAIEATWPELNRIDRFVRTGEGDPAVLLSGQYFWTWNTQEVLDMILWTRQHNAAGAGSTVRFLGFDMQYPGMGIHNVLTYLEDLGSDLLAVAEDRLACMAPFANGPDGRGDRQGYGEQPQSVRDACRADLDALFERLEGERAGLVAASSEEAFELALQSLRTVIQFEDAESGRRQLARDYHMAQNTLWILDHLGPDSKLVIWAHNAHVAHAFGSQGDVLNAALGDDYVVLGFSFFEGQATAVPINPTGSLGPVTPPTPPADSYEAHFRAADADRFFLDLRGVPFDGPATEWLAGPRPFRQIGCCLNRTNPLVHVRDMRMPEQFDVMIYFDRTGPSDALPFQFPTAF